MQTHLRRVLLRNRAFAAIAIASLALVMGLSTTIFGIVDGLLHPRYPVREQSQLYRIDFYPPSSVVRNNAQLQEARRAASQLMTQRATFFADASSERFVGPVAIEASGRTTRSAPGKAVALNYFDVIGMTPSRGRFFRSGDADAVGNFVVVSDGIWRSLGLEDEGAFAPTRVRIVSEYAVGLNPEVVIVGVMPPGGEGAIGAQVVLAAELSLGRFFAAPLVRAKTGYDRAAIEGELVRLNASLATGYGTPPDESMFTLRSITRTAPPAQRLYLALVASAIAILLIAGANLANVQLARGMTRRGELAIRMALGGSRRDLIRMLTWESAQLALIGAIAGVVLSLWGMKAAAVFLPEGIPGFGFVRPQLSWRVLGFAGIAAAVVTAIVGLLPAISISRFDLTETIKWGGGSGGGAVRSRNRRYAALVMGQIAASLAIAVGAALVFDAAVALHRLPFGFDVRPLAGFRVSARGSWRISELEPGPVLAELRSVPGVQNAAIWQHFHYDSGAVTIEGGFGDMSVFYMPPGSSIGRWVTPDFFRTLGVPPMQGSDFAADESVPAVIVDSIAAAQIWKGANPVGRMIRLGGNYSTRPFVRVIGVVPHLRWDVGLYGDAVHDLQIYYVGQTLGRWRHSFYSATAIVRGSDGEIVANQVRAQLSGTGRYRRPTSWSTFVGLDQAIAAHDVLAVIFGTLSVLALLLAAIGVYSVVAYSVAIRRREMGVRMALGASRERIFVMVVREENLTTLLGLAVGLLAANRGTQLVSDTIFETSPTQQMTIFVIATVGMFGVALLAASIPGLRAAQVNPADALRAE